MFLLPFQAKVTPGNNNLIAVGNIFPKREWLEMHRIQISTDKPIIVEILAVRDISGNNNITKQVASSVGYERATLLKHKVLFNPKISAPITLKVMRVASKEDVVDKTDEIILANAVYIVLRVTANSPAVVAGTFEWVFPDSRRLG